MTEFCNPYHFVPVEETTPEHGLTVADFDQKEGSRRNKDLKNYSHAQYYPKTFSGRILCKLTTEGAIFIGAKQERPDPKEIATAYPFELAGKPAIPASSLRGLISSLAETASNSALRVLDDRVLSYRQRVEDALSAIGMIVCQKDEQGQVAYRLKPLTLPTLSKVQEGYAYSQPRKEASPEEIQQKSIERQAFAQSFFPHNLPPYIASLRVYCEAHFLVGKETFNLAKPEFYYAKLHRLIFAKGRDNTFTVDDNDRLRLSKKGKIAIGQKIVNNSDILTSQQFEDLSSSDEKRLYTRGILRILGIEDRRDMADTKKYDLFIPYPEEKENLTWEQLPCILPEAIERFEQLADERTEATEKEDQELNILPYHPIGTLRNLNNDPKDRKLRLKEGDLVYFKPALDKEGKVVITDISFSAVWRARVETKKREKASVHHFFSKIDPELLPFNKDRESISPAELLFGFVQKDSEKSTDTEKKGGLSLAGRVQVSFGLLNPSQSKSPYQPEVILKSLLSPKPPCPIMYFKGQTNQDYITKSSLTPTKHLPQGRKMYLHQYPKLWKTVAPDKNKSLKTTIKPWETVAPDENKSLKTKIQPIRPKTVFYFHLDFYNLNCWELGLLFYALRPTETFRHKLGMGKPIGLGTVQIDPLGLFLIDREQRYRTDEVFNRQRYHQIWVNGDIPQALYPREFEATQQPIESAPFWETLRDEFAKTISPSIKNALALLGDPNKVPAVVHVPKDGHVGVDNPEIENENFKWFKTNYDKQIKNNDDKQQLTPLDEQSSKIPTLEMVSK